MGHKVVLNFLDTKQREISLTSLEQKIVPVKKDGLGGPGILRRGVCLNHCLKNLQASKATGTANDNCIHKKKAILQVL